MKTCLLILICVICVHPRLTSVAAQAPEIVKVDPPSWWVGSSLNPVRVMIRGRNLTGARVQVSGQRVGVPKISASGTYVFVDVFIASAGQKTITVTTPKGTVSAPFEVLGPLNRAGKFQGFSPLAVLYLIMIDRFADGDPTNNGDLYDRRNKFYYHGGDLQGVIDHLPYLKDLGVTAIWLTPWYDNYDRLNEI